MLVTLASVLPLEAAGRFSPGDLVQIQFLGDWKNGTVVDVNRRGDVLVEYEFAGKLSRKAYAANEVRFVYEENAIAPSRTWSDPTGNFKITAAPLGISNGKIRLRKADMTELEVDVEKLSDVDQRYIARLQKDAGTSAAGIPNYPPLERFSGDQNFTGKVASPFGAEDGRVAIAPDPIPAYLRLREGGVAFPKPDFWDELNIILPVGGPDSWLLTAVSNSQRNNKEIPTRLIWASITNKKVSKVQMLPMGEVVLDYHAPSHRLLTYNKLDDEVFSSRFGLTLWEVMPTDDAVKPLIRWDGSNPDESREEPWARIIDGRLVLHKRGKQEYVGWDVEQKAMTYKVNQESFFAPDAVLSGGGAYVFLPEDKQVRIFDSQTGTAITSIPAPNGSSGVAVSEDGRKCAVLDRNTITLYDLTNAETPPQIYQAETIGTPFTAELAFVGNDRIMVNSWNSMTLFSLEQKMPIWTYEFDLSAAREKEGRRIKTIVNNHLVYGATLRSGRETGFAVGNVELPGPLVDEKVAAMDRDELNIITPGTKVRLEVRCEEHSPRVYNALLAKIKENGWVLAQADATAVMYADMTIGKPQRTTYQIRGRFGGVEREETVTFTPRISSLKLTVEDKVVWSSGTSNGAPPFVSLREGNSIQGEVSSYQKANPGFFEQVDIPAELIDPKYKNGLGTTQVTTRGLIPQP